MKIILPTNPKLHREYFIQARLGLIGLDAPKKPFLNLNLAEKSQKKNFQTKFSFLGRKFFSYLLLFISIFSILVAGFLLIPDFYYRIFPADVKPLESLEEGSTWGGKFEQQTDSSDSDLSRAEITEIEGLADDEIEEKKTKAEASSKKIILPPKNENLPEGEWLIIPRIGVRTQVRATEDPKEALQSGVWVTPDYTRPQQLVEPEGQLIPMIMAAHRYGWQWWWKDEYWRYHSFHKLPELEPGDLVEVIADQRKWTYEIFAGEEAEQISNYEADLILYTCKFLSSPLRHFRYARLIDLEEDTQLIKTTINDN